MYEEYLEHFPSGFSEEIIRYATDVVFKSSRYIFTTREGKHQYGYCTHCHANLKTVGLRHNEIAQCPKCGSDCTVKSSGRGRKNMVDRAYFVYYEKSLIDPEAIIARGIYACRDYRYEYLNIRTQYKVENLYMFKMHNSVMLERNLYYGYHSDNKLHAGDYYKCKTIHSRLSQYENTGAKTDYSYESIVEAIKGTPFQYSTWDSYSGEDRVKFFDLYSKYPCIEYLTKVGFSDLVEAKLWGNNTYSSINWRGDTLFKAIKLTKKDFNEIRRSKISVDPLFLRLYQLSKKDGSNLSVEEVSRISRDGYAFYFTYLQIVLKYTSLKKADKYITKQREAQKKHFYSSSAVLTSWKDYIADCLKLEMNLKNDSVLFPKNLYNAHQNTIKQIKLKADAELDAKILARAKFLEKYCMDSSNIFIRPVMSTTELITEGKILEHCVGTYADRYARGDTNILVIRKVSEPDHPYFTVELRQDAIIQVRGKRNCSPGQDVSRFIEAFTMKKLKKKQVPNRVTLPA